MHNAAFKYRRKNRNFLIFYEVGIPDVETSINIFFFRFDLCCWKMSSDALQPTNCRNCCHGETSFFYLYFILFFLAVKCGQCLKQWNKCVSLNKGNEQHCTQSEHLVFVYCIFMFNFKNLSCYSINSAFHNLGPTCFESAGTQE